MPAQAQRDRAWPAFLAVYALTYMPMALYGVFMPVFLSSRGFGQAAIGAIMSVSPFVAMVAQPLWGMTADRAPNRNVVLMVLLAGSGLSVLLYLLPSSFGVYFAVTVLFLFFQMSTAPIQDAITLQHLEVTGGKFGPVRLAGTIGYAVIAAVGGMIVERDLRLQFPLSALLYLGAFVFVFALPVSRSASERAQRPRIASLLRDRELLLLLAFVTVIAATTFYYFVFFPVYFMALGGSRTLLGWSTLVATIPEILVLLLADRLVRRVKVQWIVCGVGLLTAARWLLFAAIHDPLLLLPVQAIHGLTFVLMLFAVAWHVSAVVHPDLKASGQALSGFLVAGVGRILGGLVGGFVGQQVGIRLMFMANGILVLLTVAVFGAIYLGKARRALRVSRAGAA
jgi:MFS transporter, PPP family, 3-phenylpropionic acid transporter